MESFPFRSRDLLMLVLLVAIVGYFTRDPRQMLLVATVYVVVFFFVHRLRVYLQRVLNERPPDGDS